MFRWKIWVRKLSKLIITSVFFREKKYLICAVSEKNRIMELRVKKEETESVLGNIYVGHVENINSNIAAAFVRFAENQNGYFPLEEAEMAEYVSSVKKGHSLCIGDQVLVQVGREAMKGKLPYLTSNLTFTGKYMVLTSGNKKFGLSKKLSSEDRKRLSKWFEEEIERPDKEFGCIIRTNAAEAGKEELLNEFEYLKRVYQKTVTFGKKRTAYSLLYQPDNLYLSAVRDIYSADLEEIITDIPKVRDEIQEYLREIAPEEEKKLRFYQDSLLSLSKLYRLESAMEEVCQKKIWLKSGGFLVIEQTEAFVSIDVNSGKYTDKKKAEETYRKINLEAAEEISRQLRLRNLSGIILIDFINMENPDHIDELFHVLKKKMRKDPVKASVIDITPLNILEMTRKKVRRPVVEEIFS